MRRHATTPCATCGALIVFASVRQPDGSHRTTPMDPTTPVYHRIREPDEGNVFWIEDQAPKGEMRQALARHRCGGKA